MVDTDIIQEAIMRADSKNSDLQPKGWDTRGTDAAHLQYGDRTLGVGKPDLWGTEYQQGATWEQIFSYKDLTKDDRIPSYDKPKVIILRTLPVVPIQ